jgi:hypothetical protein
VITRVQHLEDQLKEADSLTLPYSLFWLGGVYAASSAGVAPMEWSGNPLEREEIITIDERPVTVAIHGGLV